MIYKALLRVYDANGSLQHQDKMSEELTDPTVLSIKELLNPGTYTNIATQKFVADSSDDRADDYVIRTPFIFYEIHLS